MTGSRRVWQAQSTRLQEALLPPLGLSQSERETFTFSVFFYLFDLCAKRSILHLSEGVMLEY